MKELTKRQVEILTFAAKYEHDTGEPPTFYYMARALRMTPKGVLHHAQALHRKGWLASSRSPFLPRHRSAKN